jgi:integrase/recombinase XerD
MRSRLYLAARLMGPHRRLSFESVTIVLFRLREAGAAPASVNAVLSALKGVARCAWHTGLMSAEEYQRVNDVRGVRGSRLPRGRALTSEETSSLLKACERTPRSAGLRDICLVALLAGLRRAEAVALDLGHYSRRDHSLKVRGKGDKERLVYLEDGGARRALNAWLRERGDDPGPLLCPVSKQGAVVLRRLSTQAVYKVLQKRAREAGIPRLSPHDLRRTFATSLLDEGADIGSVQSLLGHTSAETTAIYDRRGEAAKRKTSALASLPYRRRRQGRGD